MANQEKSFRFFACGIFYIGGEDGDLLRFFGFPHHLSPRNPRFPHSSIPVYPSLTLCSSSYGMTLFRDPGLGAYYVWLPLRQQPDVENIPEHVNHFSLTTPRIHPADAPAVIGINPHILDVYIVCAVNEGRYRYTFDVFSNDRQMWFRADAEIRPERRIIPNTGVSCGGMACWLTEEPQAVVQFRFLRRRTRVVMRELPCPVSSATRLQLGRVGNMLGLVLVDGFLAELYVLRAHRRWERLSLMRVELRADLGVSEWNGGDRIVCREIPQPLRFESSEMEVLFWVDGRLVLWHSGGGPTGSRRATAVAIQEELLDASAPAISDSLPFISPPLLSSRRSSDAEYLSSYILFLFLSWVLEADIIPEGRWCSALFSNLSRFFFMRNRTINLS